MNEYNNIMFYVNVNKSRFIDIPRTSYDKLAKLGEDEKEILSYTKYLVNTDIKHFFQIKSHVIKFVEEMAEKGVKKFSFGANEDRKLNLYRKVAERIAEAHGYFMYEIGHSFQFYKK